jgi:hypothetical protein
MLQPLHKEKLALVILLARGNNREARRFVESWGFPAPLLTGEERICRMLVRNATGIAGPGSFSRQQR